MKQQISTLRSQVKLLNEMSSDLTMKNAIHSQIMPKSAYDSTKGGDRRQQTMQERRDMIKYYKNYKRGDRDISTKINSDNMEFAKEPNNKGDDPVMDEEEAKPQVIPVDDEIEEMADIGDENEAINGGRFHTEGHDNDVNPGSFVESEQDDGVEALPDEQNDSSTNLPSFFANAVERPRALTIHDNNV